jgi:hypothetical protein
MRVVDRAPITTAQQLYETTRFSGGLIEGVANQGQPPGFRVVAQVSLHTNDREYAV